MSLKKSGTRNPRQSNVKRFLLDCRTVMSSVSLRLVSTHILFAGKNLHSIVFVGSGKTAAFVIPMLTFISKLPPFTDENRHLGPYALILAPTRELAQQIESESKKFASQLGFTCVSIVGGVRGFKFPFASNVTLIFGFPAFGRGATI